MYNPCSYIDHRDYNHTYVPQQLLSIIDWYEWGLNPYHIFIDTSGLLLDQYLILALHHYLTKYWLSGVLYVVTCNMIFLFMIHGNIIDGFVTEILSCAYTESLDFNMRMPDWYPTFGSSLSFRYVIVMNIGASNPIVFMLNVNHTLSPFE